MVDQLARDYAAQPVVFLEQGVNAPLGARYDRFWAAYGSGTAYYPLVMASSGHQVRTGFASNLYSLYQGMVDAELARPPQAAFDAYSWRVGNRVEFFGTLTNLSGKTLAADQNGATVHALVYEEVKVGVTSRYVRAVESALLTGPLLANASMNFSLRTAALSGVDWTRLHMLVFADYRPGGALGAYDMLQAAVPVSPTFTVQPQPLIFWVDAATGAGATREIRFQGMAALNWTATEAIPWLALSTASGSLTVRPTASVTPAALAAGWQTGILTFTATSTVGLAFTQTVPVSAYYGNVNTVHLPVVLR